MDDQAIYLEPPLLRRQYDGRNDEVSRANTIDCNTPKLVRPEFGPQSDVKHLLQRYGAIPRNPKPANFSEIDYDTDLQKAFIAVTRAHQAFNRLPKKHRENYATIEDLWRALNTNTLAPDEQTRYNTTPPSTPDNNA